MPKSWPVDEPEPITTFIGDREMPADDPHHRSKYLNFAMALRGNMGMWAVYPGKVSSPSSTAARINNDAFGSLPCTDFEAKVAAGVLYVRYWPEEMRADQTRKRRHETTAPPQADTHSAHWAEVLFARVGPERADTIYKMLSRVLHPDMPFGDKQLQQELNEAKRSMQ